MNWQIIKKSVKGTSHETTGKPCQDYANYKIINNILIGAVSDGAGSAKKSEIGSKLAVKKTLEYLTEYINKYPNLDQSPFSEEQARSLFTNTTNQVIANLKEQAGKGYQFKDLSCTLLAFIVTPNWLTAMQIGDGFVVIRLQNEQDYQLLFQPSKGEYANTTTFLTSSNAMEDLQVTVINKPVEFIFASTDGLEKLALEYKNRTYKAFPKFFQPIEDDIKTDYEKEKIDIPLWLNSEQVNNRTDDDKTVLIALNNELIGEVSGEEKIKEEKINSNSENSKGLSISEDEKFKTSLILIVLTFLVNIMLGMIIFHSYYLSNTILPDLFENSNNHKLSQFSVTQYFLNIYIITAIISILSNYLIYLILAKIEGKKQAFLFISLLFLFGITLGIVLHYIVVYSIFNLI